MFNKVIQLTGQQAEYDLRMIQTDKGPTPVLIGISGRASGEMHYLSAIETIEFADKRVELISTALASTPPAHNQPRNNIASNDAQPAPNLPNSESYETELKLPHLPKTIPNISSTFDQELPVINKIKDELKIEEPHESEIHKANPAELNLNQHEGGEITSLRSLAEPQIQPYKTYADVAGVALNETVFNVTQSSLPKTIEQKLIEGTPANDQLIGTAGNDRIDGLRNTEISNALFHEEFFAGSGDDVLFYRGFFGDINLDSQIKATLLGEGGNDSLNVLLDRTTQITVDGGDGINSLTVEAPNAPFSPWDPNLIEWSWAGLPSSPTLSGMYVSNLHTQAGINETTASFQTISAANATPLNIVRPDFTQPTQLTGGDQADFLLATTQTKEVHAGLGNDTIIAREGNMIDAGGGINSIFAYSSDVTLDYANSSYAINLNLANKIGLIFDDASNLYSIDRLLSPIRNAIGSAQSDTLKGDEQNNTLHTHGGSDNLEGGAGADIFVIDLDGNTTVTIHDFSIAESDEVLLNLSQWVPPSNVTAFNQYQVIGDNHEIWWSDSLNQEEGALLTVMISQENHNIQIGQGDQLQTAVSFDHSIDNWTTEDWSTALHIDYL